MTNRDEIYTQVTEQIIKDLEVGVVPWESPWFGRVSLPKNVTSQAGYNGINILILWMKQKKAGFASSQWLTYKQAQSLGGNIKKGEKETSIIYYKQLSVSEKSDDNEVEDKLIPILKTHSVFNLGQTEGLDSLLKVELENFPSNEIELCEKAEQVVTKSSAQVQNDQINQAFYNIDTDSIHLPQKTQFKDQIGYYSTLLHELTHWTGAKNRLDRDFDQKGKIHYAEEELVAELGSSFLCAHVGLKYTTQHASYIESWLSLLKKDKSAIFKAASLARKSTEYLAGSK